MKPLSKVKWELISIDPLAESEKGHGLFLGYAVLGKTKVAKEESRTKVIRSIQESIEKTPRGRIGHLSPEACNSR